MKHLKTKQHINLSEFVEEYNIIVRRYAYGSYMLSFGICALFNQLLGLPLIVGAGIASCVSGSMYLIGKDFVAEKIEIWVDKLSTIREEDETEDVRIDSEPIKEPSAVVIRASSQDDEVPFEVSITHEQLRDAIEVMFYDTYLTRSSLDPNVWPSLTERWRSKEIQRKFMSLGLINHSNIFLVSESGSIGRLEREIDNLSTSANGVGGSE